MAANTFGIARLRASQARPYFACALAAMQPVAVQGLGTMAVDRYWRVYYDPIVSESWQEKAASVVVHELGHLLRRHVERAESIGDSLNVEAWQIAVDAEINDSDFDEDLTLPGHPWLPSSFGAPNGLIAEQYYEMLLAAGHKTCQGVSPTDSNGADPCGSTPSGAASAGNPMRTSQAPGQRAGGPPKPSGGETIPGRSCAQQDAPQGAGGCGAGSGVDGKSRPWELPPKDKDQPGLTAVEAKLIRRQVAQAIRKHVRDRGMGSVPAGWRRWSDEQLEPPRVHWTQELASTLRGQLAAAGVHDYAYSRPSRRRLERVILPSMRARRPKVGIVIDTSGSMGDKDIADACSEVQGICRSHQADVLVVSVDAAVHSRQRVTSTRQLQLDGGGGTDMGVGIAELERARRDVIVVLTDGYNPWPDSCPQARTIVCLIGDCADKSTVPSWARAIVRDGT